MCRHARCKPSIVSLRAAGGFGEKPKQDSSPVSKGPAEEKAADPQKALESDLADMRKAMGSDNSKSAIDGFEATAMEPSTPEKQVCGNV